MLAKRIIPTVLCRGRQLVKGQRFDAWRVVGNAAQATRIHGMRGVDEVCLLDIAATPELRRPDLTMVAELAEALFVPLTVGGGVRNIMDVHMLLRAGADKVVIGAEAFRRPGVLKECSGIVGCQAIVAAVDVDQDGRVRPRNDPMAIGLDAVDLAGMYQVMGAGEILLTAKWLEGTMQGYDLPLIERVARALEIPVIAHGGAGTYQHMLEAIQAGADAVAAGAMFQFTDQTPEGAARYFAERGVEARIPLRPDPAEIEESRIDLLKKFTDASFKEVARLEAQKAGLDEAEFEMEWQEMLNTLRQP